MIILYFLISSFGGIMADLAKKDLFDTFDKKIKDLYIQRDKYYIVNKDCNNPNERNDCLNASLNALVAELESLDQSKFESKASYLVLTGKAYSVLIRKRLIRLPKLSNLIINRLLRGLI